MTMHVPSPTKGRNRLALIVCILAAVLAFVLMTLPIAEFTTAVYTRKSGNTFKDDERYVAAKAEAEAAMADYAHLGALSLDEEATVRVNSKGQTTSMYTFTVRQTVTKNAWQLMAAGLTPSVLLMGIAGCIAAALVLALLGLKGAEDTLHRELKGRAAILRTVAGFLGLLALLLVPVVAMTCTKLFIRNAELHAAGRRLLDAGTLAAMDGLLYGGQAGDSLTALLKGLSQQMLPTFWLLMPVLFVLLCGLIVLRKGELGKTLLRGLLYLFVIALSIFILYPFYVMFITGFRSNVETTDMYFLNMLPTQWVFSNLTDIVNRGVLGYLFNSILLSTGATAIAMVCGIPAAYALARMNFRGKNVFMGFVIMSQMFSPVVLLVGISRLMNALGLNDTISGLMLINAAFNQAFAIWLLRGTFVSISPEMEQAACIDGCGTVGALTKILLPMAAPGIVTTLIFIFINSWNEYTISTVLISTPAKNPITVGITQFSSFNMIEWQYLFAAALLATVPVIILFMCIEKHLAAGLTSGGVKG